MKNQDIINEYLSHYIDNDNKELFNLLQNHLDYTLEQKYHEETDERLRFWDIPSFKIIELINNNQHDIETVMLCTLTNYHTFLKYNVDLGLIEQLADRNNIAFCLANDSIAVNLSIERSMYDDSEFANYYTKHITKITKDGIFMTDGKSPLDMYINLDEFTGVGNTLGYTAYLENDWEQKVQYMTPSKYMLRQIESMELYCINNLELIGSFREALPIYRYVFIESQEEIHNFMNTKNINMECMDDIKLLNIVKLLGEYSDCPSDMKLVSDKLLDDKIFTVCMNILYGGYEEYSFDIDKVDNEITKWNNELKDIQMIKNNFEEWNGMKINGSAENMYFLLSQLNSPIQEKLYVTYIHYADKEYIDEVSGLYCYGLCGKEEDKVYVNVNNTLNNIGYLVANRDIIQDAIYHGLNIDQSGNIDYMNVLGMYEAIEYMNIDNLKNLGGEDYQEDDMELV